MLLKTERLVIRPIVESDLDDLFEYHSDANTVRYIPWEVRTREDVAEWFERSLGWTGLEREGDNLVLGFADRDTNKIIGQLNAHLVSLRNSHLEFGYVLNPKFAGRGLAAEAVTAFINYLFSDLGFRRLVAVIDVRNRNSIRLVEKLGFRREATHIEDDFLKGELCDTHRYALLSREWSPN